MMEETSINSIKTKVIFKQRMAGFLMQRGFVLVGMRRDSNHPRRNVFLFKDTPDLDAAMSEYIMRMR